MSRRSLPLSLVYRLLEPGPVLLLTTAHRGRRNVMTLSWHTMLDFAPPRIGCVLSSADVSFAALRASRQCVLNIPTRELAAAVVGCGNSHGDRIDKFERFGLTPQPARRVEAPRIAECSAGVECRVVDPGLVKRYELFVVEGVAAWHDPALPAPATLHHRGRGRFMVAGEEIRLASRMR